MSDSLLDSYNPLYDIHLRQYFSLPHMQKHLRRIGLIDSSSDTGSEVYARHHAMLDMMLKNREVQLMRMAELRRKLDAAEKVETCRRIRSGQSPESYNRVRSSRSLSRGRRGSSEKQRRYSNCLDDKEIVQRIENEHVQPVDYDPKDPYSRLSASIRRFQYLHRLDDPTLCTYKENLKKTASTSGESWFFRRRSSNTTRGRKSHQSPHSTATSHSQDSRTSCPPSGRKRKDSNSRLPPIGIGKASKSFHPQSHPLLNAPSPSYKPPSVRGRPVTKKPAAAPKVATTHNMQPQNNGLPPRAISDSTAIKEQSAIATTETANKSNDTDEGSVEETLPTLRQEEAENRKYPLHPRGDDDAVETCNSLAKESAEKFVAEKDTSSLPDLRNGDRKYEMHEIPETIKQPFSRTSELLSMSVDLPKVDLDKCYDGESSYNEIIRDQSVSKHTTSPGEDTLKSSDFHQSILTELELKHAKDSTHSSGDVALHTDESLRVEEDIKADKKSIAYSTNLNIIETSIAAARSDDENEKSFTNKSSSSPTSDIADEHDNRYGSTPEKTLSDDDVKLDDHLHHQGKKRTAGEEVLSASSEEIEGKEDNDSSPEVNDERQMLKGEIDKASSRDIGGKEDQDTTPESIVERQMLEREILTASSEEIERKRDQDATPESIEERQILEGDSHKASSKGIEGKSDQDTTSELIVERQMLEEETHKASSRDIGGKEDQDTTPESIVERQMLEREILTAFSEEIERKRDQDSTPEPIEERQISEGDSHKASSKGIEGKSDQDTTSELIVERQMLEEETHKASSRDIGGKEDQDTTPESIVERQMLEREILTAFSEEIERKKRSGCNS
ncbi:hypothetical protein KIN20_028297 [Parelaphostrongylus tenuis]|uniref:Uncharacterized protein n=1 Tax=Parelaphostrongylus tenuis TaxID=148309 RepID=A0AAD5R0L4_PARTN|nr:hypothetical protein KIN20_028297 [Parelaphostrongylus tenuis]